MNDSRRAGSHAKPDAWPSRGPRGSSTPSPGLILVVEDDADIRESLTAILEIAGHDVVPASSGLEALEFLRRDLRPCLILLDLMMPGMNGWQLRNELLDDPDLAHIPVVVVSACEATEATLPVQIAAFLPKPLDADALLATIERCCGRRA